MLVVRRMALGILAWGLCVTAAGAQTPRWERVEVGDGEAAFTAVAVDVGTPARLLTATPRTLYESLDGGAHWQARFHLPTQASVTAIATNSTPKSSHIVTLLATDRGLYGSLDGGRQWSFLFRGPGEAARQCTRVAFHPSDTQTALLGTRNGLFLSTDSGERWVPVHLPIAARDVVHFAWDPEAASRLYLVSTAGVFVGSLPGGSWERRLSVLGAEATEVEQSESGVTDETDEEPGSLHRLSALAVDPQQPATLYLGGDRGLAMSTDAGLTWTRPARASAWAGAIAHLLLQRHSPLVLYAATSHGVAGYDPAHGRWKALTDGLTTTQVRDLVATPTHLWAATDQGLYRYEIPPDLFVEPEPPTVQALLENFTHEPTIGEVREDAIRYAEVHPEKIRRWRQQAYLRTLLPTVDIGVGKDRANNVTLDQGTFPKFQLIDTQDQKSGLDLSVKWELGNLIWNGDQTSIDVRSKLMVQLRNDIVDEVTRTYFERRRLQAALMTGLQTNQAAMLEQELRLQELTAMIDGLTGGAFSRRMAVYGNRKGEADGRSGNGAGGQAIGEVRR